MNKLLFLIDYLIKENNYDIELNEDIKSNEEELYKYFRYLMNIRMPKNISEEYLILTGKAEKKGNNKF